MRVHILAKELNVTSKIVLQKCRAEGLGDVVKNHMSALGAGLEATIREWFSEGTHSTTVETAERIDLEKVRVRRRREPEAVAVIVEERSVDLGGAGAETSTAVSDDDDAGVTVAVESGTVAAPVSAPAPASAPAAPEVGEPQPAEATPASESGTTGAGEETTPVVSAPELAPPAVPAAPEAGSDAPDAPAPDAPAPDVAAPTAPAEDQPARVAAAAPATATDVPGEGPPPPAPIKPAGPQNVPAPARISGPRVVRYEAPDRDIRPPRPRSTAGPRPMSDATPSRHPSAPGRRDPKGEAARSKAKPRRGTQRDSDTREKLLEWRDQDLAERRARLQGATGRKIHRRRTETSSPGGPVPGPSAPKTRASVHEPVTIRGFCAATGINQIQVFARLRREYEMIANINTILPTETAQLLALDLGIELEVVAAKTGLDVLEEEVQARARAHPRPRPPIVTMMGHVDHGKTSLLDAIRKTRVVAGEDGGITQHISSYHLKRDKVAVTFLDTPGHKAFTAMRARGANLTDIVVLVVAADDGVMPQTLEAINHARAADTPIMVALNKIDLGRDNEMQVFGQLAEHDLAPVSWGGQTEVVATSATTGEGIDQLLETLTTLSELLELTADPTVDAMGTVIEAQTKQGVGAVVRAIVQEGTLSVGDVLVCGCAHGKVRALLDDRGRRIRKAGPAMPVEIWGLSDVPLAGDRFYQVGHLQRATQIGEEVKRSRLVESRSGSQKVLSLEDMFKQHDAGEVPELNVILKADVQGSVDALTHMFGELPTDQVKLTVRHAGVGAVTDSDVLLAAASHAIVIGFRVQTGTGSRRLAEEHGVDVRHYLVVYEVVNDIRKAMEGLLAPEEHVEARGTAEVREVFKVSKVGRVAGCYVTTGPIRRAHLAKVVRDGVVVRDRAPIASLRHFKDDVKEVRAGLECGIMLENFSDIHVGDMIETFEVVEVARTLD